MLISSSFLSSFLVLYLLAEYQPCVYRYKEQEITNKVSTLDKVDSLVSPGDQEVAPYTEVKMKKSYDRGVPAYSYL